MAYYAAVVSLRRTIVRLLYYSEISILPPSRTILKFAHKKVCSLRKVLQRLESSNNREMVDSLREEIRDAAYKLEDAIQFRVSDKSLGDDGSSLVLSLDLDEGLKQECNSFIGMVKKMEDHCSKLYLELSNAASEEDDPDSSRIDFGGMESKMVGLSNDFGLIKERLLMCLGGGAVSISGMAGIGKTTLAREIFQDPDVFNYFDYRLWVTIGSKYQLRKIMLYILAKLDHDVDNIQMEGNEKLAKYLRTSLEGRRYLIVLDDVWNTEHWDELKEFLPLHDGSRVLLITRLRHVADQISFWLKYEMRFLHKEESWFLLREKVFGEELCPLQLERAGKKIAQNCDGLPLLIVTIADLLSKVEKTPENWNKVANNKNTSIFREANDKISNILLRSYKYLPQDLKACFLYMGVFPLKCMIPASKLFNLWTAEDLFESKYFANERLEMLVSSNLVLAQSNASTVGIKTCRLHSSFWYACVKQSWKEKFLHVISSLADHFEEGVESPRRLCTYNNILFGFKEVYNSVESISNACSLICSGPYHQYPVPISFGLRLLKVLDVLSVRFYKFPVEVVKLIHLRYLALTYNGKVPASISKLWNLEYLILHRHLNIKFLGDWSYLPLEIWNLQKLTHLQVIGSCLPYLCDVLLPKLLKLSNMSAHNCTKEIFERIPNLEKLGIQIELAPDVVKPLSCFNHLSHLSKLESLKCVIVNPNSAKPQVVAPPTCISFPSGLIKLSLKGCGFPWECMHIIAKLPRLEVLKLQCYAFRGSEWVVCEDDFQQLDYLQLEDIDLVHLRANGDCFPILNRLIIRHCYKLKEIPLEMGRRFMSIEVVDSPSVAKHIQMNQRTRGSRRSQRVYVHSSWDDGELKA